MSAILRKVTAKVFGTANERSLKPLWPIVSEINMLEFEMGRLSDDELRGRTAKLREHVEKGMAGAGVTGGTADEQKQALRATLDEVLDEILVEAFAVVREASRRATGMRHFDIQLIGGMVLHRGIIAEMKTGEGKTLVATLPAYLNALAGRGVHVVTANDYLAKRDAEWIGTIYRFLGQTVGCIQHDMDDDERQEAYFADITYGANNEFGFDYLRDNMKFEPSAMVQRGHYYAIVDEVDSILIDDARTPLSITGASEDSTEKYYVANDCMIRLKAEQQKLIAEIRRTDGDVDLKHDRRLLYHAEENQQTASITETGAEMIERFAPVGNLYDPGNVDLLHCVEQSLKAHTLYHLDKHYIVKDGEVIIIDDLAGGPRPGRRWSDGLHQAVEAKEGVRIEAENQTLATVTLQNYFRMYPKLAGMTDTAETDAAEFTSIYNLHVVVVPSNHLAIRRDYADVIYRTAREKWDAVLREIQEFSQKGQPVLVGTVSLEDSEMLSAQLKRRRIPHVVLNANPGNPAREAEIIGRAGRKAEVTVVTSMAGRGTGIVLGGDPEFLAREWLMEQGIYHEATSEQWAQAAERARKITDAEREEVVRIGGLHVIGTERHESRRIDNQLRGRGQQGNPGSSRFYLSLEDKVMQAFGGEHLKGLMLRLGMEEGVPIESRLVSKRIEAAQKSFEGHNASIRKLLLAYDDVMNKQREVVYAMRRQLLTGFEGHNADEQNTNQRLFILGIAEDDFDSLIEQHMPKARPRDEWDIIGLKEQLRFDFGFDADREQPALGKVGPEEAREMIWPKLEEMYRERELQLGLDAMRTLERYIMLNIVDAQWKDHLLALDRLKAAVSLPDYGQENSLVRYIREAESLFEEMPGRIGRETLRYLFNFQVQASAQVDEQLLKRRRRQRRGRVAFTKDQFGADEEGLTEQSPGRGPRIGRSDPCPCGSGKKYKKCCGT